MFLLFSRKICFFDPPCILQLTYLRLFFLNGVQYKFLEFTVHFPFTSFSWDTSPPFGLVTCLGLFHPFRLLLRFTKVYYTLRHFTFLLTFWHCIIICVVFFQQYNYNSYSCMFRFLKQISFSHLGHIYGCLIFYYNFPEVLQLLQRMR